MFGGTLIEQYDMDIWDMVILWVMFGLHSAWYLIHCYTRYHDFTSSQALLLLACFMLPIVSHIAVYIEFKCIKNGNTENRKTWFRKRDRDRQDI